LIRKLARDHVDVFCEYVGRDELTGMPIVQAPIHRSWHRVLDDYDRAVIWAHIEAGKTFQLSVLRTLFELGHDPNLRCLILSNTQGQARKIARVVKQYIESSAELHEIFPDLKPGDPWGELAFSVKRSTFSKDPSVQISGLHGNIQGSRIERGILDDVLDFENTLSEENRKDTFDWLNSALFGRLTENARVRVIGTAFHPQDLLHRLARTSGWEAVRYPVLDPVTGQPRWPERWSLARINKARDSMTPIEFASQLMCEARDESTNIFSRAGIELALRLGDGTEMAQALQVLPPGYRTYTGVDLAVQQKDSADQTCLFTIAIDPMGNRHVLGIETGRWSGPEIVGRIHGAHARYNSIVVVENNQAQDFIAQFARVGTSTPIIGYTTGRNKAHPEHGITSISVEMVGGKWRVPNDGGHLTARMHPEVRGWIDEMLYYSPAAHTGDRLMASFFAREGARLGANKVESITSVDFNRR
jgi:hypothetical protein